MPHRIRWSQLNFLPFLHSQNQQPLHHSSTTVGWLCQAHVGKLSIDTRKSCCKIHFEEEMWPGKSDKPQGSHPGGCKWHYNRMTLAISGSHVFFFQRDLATPYTAWFLGTPPRRKGNFNNKKSPQLHFHPLDNRITIFVVKKDTLFQAHLRMGRCFLHSPKRFSGLMRWQVLSQVLQELGKHRNLTRNPWLMGRHGM